MKLAIGGASGFVGSEILRRAFRSEDITAIVAIGRRNVSAPEGFDESKLSNVVLKDLTEYSDDAKKNLADVDACIWTISITPSKSKSFSWEEVKKVCQESAVSAVKALVEARKANSYTQKPLRFVYFSGVAAERDQTKSPRFMPEHMLMRGEAENLLLRYAADSGNAVEVCCMKPGLIMSQRVFGRNAIMAVTSTVGFPSVKVEECAATSLKQCFDGIEKEPLTNEDIRSIGSVYLKNQDHI